MSGHTPGPWVVSNREFGTWKTEVRAVDPVKGRRVATTFVLNSPKPKKGESRADYRARYDTQARTNEANARLIGAAPDLLNNARCNLNTMLEQARRCELWGKSHAELDIAIEETRIAIARLTAAQ